MVNERLERLKQTGKRLGKRALDLVDRVGDAAIDTVVDFHNGVQEKGGYFAASKGAVNSVVDSTRNAYKSIQDNYFPDGKLDFEKMKGDLTDFGYAAKTYGRKAATVLRDLAMDAGREAYASVTDFKEKYIPTDDELRTKYAGIGTDNKFPLFRQHYEGCLKFHAETSKLMEKSRSKFRDEILNDIKSSGSESVAELREYYSNKVAYGDSALRPNYINKLGAIEKYFK